MSFLDFGLRFLVLELLRDLEDTFTLGLKTFASKDQDIG